MEYLMPRSVAEATEMLADGGRQVLAGGTDFFAVRAGRPIDESVVDITRIGELRGIVAHSDHYRLGSLTRWADVARAELPTYFDGLRLAAREVGSVQVQNAGTIGGNLCNASPAADGIPPFLTLDASVELVSTVGTRVLPLRDFLTGYRQTALLPGELLTAVLVPRVVGRAASAFMKLGSRRYLVISIVVVAALICADSERRVAAARVAVGSCSPVAQRAIDLESDLAGISLDQDLGALATADHLAMLSPIDDLRGSAAFRREAALVMVRRALRQCGEDL